MTDAATSTGAYQEQLEQLGQLQLLLSRLRRVGALDSAIDLLLPGRDRGDRRRPRVDLPHDRERAELYTCVST
jgi:hypothetical protein